MTREIYFQLKPFEVKMKNAIKSNYTRFTKAEFDAFEKAYTNHYGKGLTPNERSCSVCKLHAVQKIGKEYFAYVEWAKKFKGEEWLNDC